jgi:hypothetical protein
MSRWVQHRSGDGEQWEECTREVATIHEEVYGHPSSMHVSLPTTGAFVQYLPRGYSYAWRSDAIVIKRRKA